MEIFAEKEKTRLFLFHLASLFLDTEKVGDITVTEKEEGVSVSVAFCGITKSGIERINTILHKEKERAFFVALGKAFVKAVSTFETKKVPYGTLVGVRPVKVPLFYLANGFSEEETERILINEYFVSEEKAKLLLSVAGKEAALSFEENDIVLYISIPFCPSRCSYCSFVSVGTAKEGGLIGEYLSVLFREIEKIKDVVVENSLRIRAIYVGGGTPGILDERQLEKLVSLIKETFSVPDDVEFTVEIGRPDTVTKEKLLILSEHGIKRICINPQTTSDSVLSAIGRKHTARDFFNAMELAGSIGGFSINCDLILGLTGDDHDTFMRSLSDVLSFRPENVTLHALCLKNASSIDSIPSSADFPETMSMAHSYLINSGFSPYYLYRQKNAVANLENTGFTVPSHESIYNIAMMEDMVTVISAGAGASTKIVRKKGPIERFYSFKYPAQYVSGEEKINANFIKIKKLISEK